MFVNVMARQLGQVAADVEEIQAASKRSANKQIVVWKNIIELVPVSKSLRAKTLFNSGESMANSVTHRSRAKKCDDFAQLFRSSNRSVPCSCLL